MCCVMFLLCILFLLQMDARGVRELFARVMSAIALCVREEEVGIELYDSVDFGAFVFAGFLSIVSFLISLTRSCRISDFRIGDQMVRTRNSRVSL